MANLMTKPNNVTKYSYNLIRKKAGELLGQNPAITDRELCEKLNISYGALKRIKQDRLFYEKAEDTFEKTITRDLLLVDVAMIREAQAGNVQAARYLAERHGKFVKKFQIEVKSPYELFAKEIEADETEFEEVKEEKPIIEVSQKELPERDERNKKPAARIKEERKHLHKTLTRMKREKSPKYRADKRDRYYLKKRANIVGLELLPKGRPKPHAKKEWLKKLYELEAKAKAEKLDKIKPINS